MRLVILFTCLFTVVQAYGYNYTETNRMDGLFEMSLEDLLQLTVTTSSGNSVSILEAPAVVTVVTHEQISASGYDNLYDVLNLLPGINRVETYFGYTTLNFRGTLQDHYNNKVLFQVNGHPVPERTFGSSHLEFVPLGMIERIEVIRGPASALYGTNAMMGVVNIITKNTGKDAVRLQLGSDGYQSADVTHISEYIRVGVSVKNHDGFDYQGTNDELGNAVSLDYQNDIKNLYLNAEYQNVTAQLGWFEQNKAKMGMNPVVFQSGLSNNRAWFADIAYNRTRDTHKGEIRLRYDNFKKDIDAGNFPAAGSPTSSLQNKVERFGLDMNWRWSHSQSSTLTLGYSYDQDETAPLVFVYDADGSVAPFSPYTGRYSVNNHGIYAQWEQQFDQRHNLILGVRAEDNEDTGSSGLLPRAGLATRLTNALHLKILYGEAFRSPGFIEKYANVAGALFGSTDLDNEAVKNIDVNLDWIISSGSNLSTTLYHYKIEREIKRRIIEGSNAAEFYNASGRKVMGAELSYNLQAMDSLRLTVNADYKDGEEGELNFLNYTEKYTWALLAEYRYRHNIRLTASAEAIGSRKYVLNSGFSGELPAYEVLNLQGIYNYQGHSVSLAVLNVNDEKYHYPEYVRQNIAAVPGGAGRELRGTWLFSF